MSGALLEASSQWSSSSEDDEAITPDDIQDSTVLDVRGGGDANDRATAFVDSVEEWNTRAHRRYPLSPLEEEWEAVDSKDVEPNRNQPRSLSVSQEVVENEAVSENEKEKIWKKSGNAYFSKEEDSSFESRGEASDSERDDTSINAASRAAKISHGKVALASLRPLAPTADDTRKPENSSRKVAFNVEEDVGDEEANRYVQWRCVCLSFPIQ